MRDIPRLIRSFILSLGGEGIQSGFHFVLNLILIPRMGITGAAAATVAAEALTVILLFAQIQRRLTT